MAFQPVDPKAAFPQLEQALTAWWAERGIVKQALAAGDRARPFVFFEGPPTMNGRPGVHHVEARAVKDAVNRFQRMRGRYVLGARGGWDTHGLPVEVQVERQLGFSGKPDIERYGVAAFNAACRASAHDQIGAFEQMTERIGYWLDLDNAYITYENSYVESLWWVFQQLWRRDLLFRDYKVTMHCPRCGTSLSAHEVAQGFQDDVDDPSVWVRFPIRADVGSPHAATLRGAAFLAWTTTPWTLPANVALAVDPDAAYVLVGAKHSPSASGDTGIGSSANTSPLLVLAEALADRVLGEGNYTVLASFAGRELAGLRYAPLFAGVPSAGQSFDPATAYRVVADQLVSLDDGTGVVHLAPAYGDLEAGRRHGLPTLFSVDLSGAMLPDYDALGFGGVFFKQADPLITRDLEQRGLLFRGERVRHSYPFCWRCGTPLLYYAKQSWYIRTTALKDRLLAHNQAIDWVPTHVRDGRFGDWLENNVDWAVSRERYWGTPLPIWVCDGCGQTEVLGSLAELSARAGCDLSRIDLHRPAVDEPSWACEGCGGRLRRVPDVADVWFDTGAMPVAQWHYPFENQALFEVAGQADFVAEGLDQTRGWFYTLHAVSTLLFDRPAFTHAICLGILQGADGRRMSKSRGTAVDPFALIEQFGADAVRWYMFASAPPYNSRVFLPEHVGAIVRQFMLTLWNTYSFFVTYANLDGWTPNAALPPAALQPIDRWALARLAALTRDVTLALDSYDIHAPAKALEAFVEQLSNWYVRRNRRRFWKADDTADKHAAYATLYTCLTTLARLLAPFMPFLSEALYQNLVAQHTAGVPPSVHLTAWPQADPALADDQLLADTDVLLDAISLGRAARRSAGIKLRQPLAVLWLRVPPAAATALQRFDSELRDELNVKAVRYLDAATDLVAYRFKPNLRVVGKRYGTLVPRLTQALGALAGAAAQEAAQRLEAGQALTLMVDGQTLELTPDAVLVESTAPAGYAVAEHGGLLLALDTTLTPALVQEGQARELVRQIQDARKAAGLAIADRVVLTLDGADAALAAVVEAWGGYLRAETLASRLALGAPAPGATVSTLDLDGLPITLGLAKSD